MSVNTVNMNLIQPTIGVDNGITWEQSFNSNAGILDGHTHAAGSGVQIQPSGINISSDLSFNSNNAINLRSSRYTPQVSPLSLGTDLGCVYVAGADLYYNDTAGNQVRLTAGGLVNATSSGIADGTATASFSGGVLVVDENTNTPGNIEAGSYLMGQVGVAGSNFLTLQPPASLSSGSYALTLPAIGATAGIVLMDNAGNMSVGPTAPSVTSYLAMNSSGVVSTTIPTAPNVLVSSSCGTFSTNSTSPTQITNFSLTITTAGRPVTISTQPDGNGGGNPANYFMQSLSGIGYIQLLRGATMLALWEFNNNATPVPFSLTFLDTPAAGTYTYSMKAYTSAAPAIAIQYSVMVAYSN